MQEEAHHAAERAARDSYGRLVAFLSARTRDLAGAEDALADAFATALRLWPTEGVPHNPDAWLLTVARRRQTDALRRSHTRRTAEPHLALIADEIEAATLEPDTIPDRRLALMFACAHPAIDPGLRTPLILQTVLGLNAAEIAAAFLIPAGTMGQRLVRAKTRIRETGIPFAIPEPENLTERLGAVLDAIYAAYGKAWAEFGEPQGRALAGESLFLARLVARLLPDAPEALGMLALMLYAEARHTARRHSDGRYAPLDEQDTDLWDRTLLDEAELLLRRASSAGPTGRYQLEAAIQSAHVARRLHGVDTAAAIVALYDHLLALTGSPVVALNRAAALARRDGPQAALAALAPLADDRRMRDYQPFWATLGHFRAIAGDRSGAHEALTLAIGLCTDPATRHHLLTRLTHLPDA